MTTDVEQQESSLADDLATNLVLEDESPEVEAAEEVEAQATEEVPPLEPPPKWDKRYKEVFSEWGQHPNGRTWQEAVIDLYKEQQGYSTKVEQERSEIRKQLEQYQRYAQTFNEALSPYQQLIQELGATPDTMVRQGMGLLAALRNNPQQTLLRLAREANIDLRSALEGEPWQSPESKEIENLKREIARMNQTRQQQEQYEQYQRLESMRRDNAAQIQAFVDATDESGSKLHPHVEAVEQLMAELIYGRENLRRQNPSLPSMTLEEAYERACKLSPDLAQAEAKERDTARLAKADAEAKKAAAAAKRVPSGRAGKEPSKKSLRDEIMDNLVTDAA